MDIKSRIIELKNEFKLGNEQLIRERLFKENCLVVFKANLDVKNGISKLKVIELKDYYYKIGNDTIRKEHLFQRLLNDFERELDLNTSFYYPYFPFRATIERAKKDLLCFVEKELLSLKNQNEYLQTRLKKFNNLKRIAER